MYQSWDALESWDTLDVCRETREQNWAGTMTPQELKLLPFLEPIFLP
jgi:hypothetical protein